MIKRQLLFALTVAVAAGSCTTGSTDSAPTPTEPRVAARTLPIEVFWKNSEESIEVVLSADAAASAVYFSTRLNNIDGPDRVAIGLNDSPYVSVNKANVETDGLGEGQDLAGDFKFPNTRDIRFKVPAGTLKGASCNDCHVDTSDATHDGDGYDLKYFNYSNHAIVNMGDINRKWTENVPVDGAYILNINSDFLEASGFAGAAQLYALSLRMMQERVSYNVPSLSLQTSYDPDWGQDPTRIFMQSKDAAWRGIAPADKTKMLSAIMKAHYEYLKRFTTADFRSAGLTQDFETINGNGDGPTFLSRLRAILMYMHADDPTSTLKNEIARKADLKFPGFNFSSSALGNGGIYVAAYLASRVAQGTDPKTGQPIYTYPRNLAPGWVSNRHAATAPACSLAVA